MADYCIERLLNDNQKIIKKIIDNYDLIGKLPILHLKGFISSTSYKEDRKLIDEVLDNKKIINVIKEDIYTKDNILGKMEILNELDQNSESYKDLYDDIIQVGEYPIN